MRFGPTATTTAVTKPGFLQDRKKTLRQLLSILAYGFGENYA